MVPKMIGAQLPMVHIYSIQHRFYRCSPDFTASLWKIIVLSRTSIFPGFNKINLKDEWPFFKPVSKLQGFTSMAVSLKVRESSHKQFNLLIWWCFYTLHIKTEQLVCTNEYTQWLPALNSLLLILSPSLTQFDTHSSSSFLEIFSWYQS